MISAVSSICRVKEGVSDGEWLRGGAQFMRRYRDGHFRGDVGTWGAKRSDPFHCSVCLDLDSSRQKEAAMEEYKVRWNPLSICWDVLAVCLWLVAIRRATSI